MLHGTAVSWDLGVGGGGGAGFAPTVGAEVFRPVGVGLHAVADGHGGEGAGGITGHVERGEARVAEGVGKGAGEELGG